MYPDKADVNLQPYQDLFIHTAITRNWFPTLPGLVFTRCHDQQLDHYHTMTLILIKVKKLKPNKKQNKVKLNHGSLPYHDLNCNQGERYVIR